MVLAHGFVHIISKTDAQTHGLAHGFVHDTNMGRPIKSSSGACVRGLKDW